MTYLILYLSYLISNLKLNIKYINITIYDYVNQEASLSFQPPENA